MIYILLLGWGIFVSEMDTNLQKRQMLFDGKSLQGWEIANISGHGPVYVSDSCIVLGKGKTCTGVKWTQDFPRVNYEVALEAQRTDGDDFFCGMTFPVREAYCTLIIGGWGGYVVGLSSIDGYDAAYNATGQMRNLYSNRWYSICLRVRQTSIEAWIDSDKIVDFEIGIHRLSLRWEMASFRPFGIATWKTTGMLRRLSLRQITQ
jgi:hypothetical protein